MARRSEEGLLAAVADAFWAPIANAETATDSGSSDWASGARSDMSRG